MLRGPTLSPDALIMHVEYSPRLAPTPISRLPDDGFVRFRYKPARKFKGLITLIRAEQGAAREEDVGRDYGLSAVTAFFL